jgi:hypothetical protein
MPFIIFFFKDKVIFVIRIENTKQTKQMALEESELISLQAETSLDRDEILQIYNEFIVNIPALNF